MSEPVAQVSAIEPGTMQRVDVNGVGVLLCNVDGTFYAVQDVCTHDGSELDTGELDGTLVMCPRHGALFDVTTGAAMTLPAVVGLPTFGVRIDGDDIYIG